VLAVEDLSLVLVPAPRLQTRSQPDRSPPDLAGWLGFLSEGQTMLALVVLAGSVVIAGQSANALAYRGATLAGFKFIFLAYAFFLIAPLFWCRRP
jgi:hypothetical protein